MVCLTFPLSEEEQRLVAEVGRPEAEVSLREDFARRFSVTPACIISDGEALFALRRQDGRRVMARFGA